MIQTRIANVLEKGNVNNIDQTVGVALQMLRSSGLSKRNKIEYDWIIDHIESWRVSMLKTKAAINLIKPLES